MKTPRHGLCWSAAPPATRRNPYHRASGASSWRGFVLVLLCVCRVSFAQQTGLTLVPVKAEWCGPCRQFDRDCVDKRPGMLYYRLASRFVIGKAVDVDTAKGRALIRKHKIKTVPTFLLLTESGGFAGKVAGYVGPVDLDRRLVQVITSWQEQEESSRSVMPQADDCEGLRQAHARLLQQLDAMDAAKTLADSEVESLRKRVAALMAQLRAADVSQGNGESLRDLRLQWEQKILELQKAIDAAKANAVPPAVGPPDGSDPVPPLRPDAVAGTATSDKWMRLLSGVGKLGVAVLAPEIALPAGAAITAMGCGWGWLRRRKQERGDTRTVIVDGPRRPGTSTLQTQFVDVPSDSYRKAHEVARQHIARRYPGSQEVLEAELSLTRQFMAGQV